MSKKRKVLGPHTRSISVAEPDTITIAHTSYSTADKRPRHATTSTHQAHIDTIPEPDRGPTHANTRDHREKEEKRTREHHTFSQLLNDMKTHKESFLEDILRLEWDPSIAAGDTCPNCHTGQATCRCEDCFLAPPQCPNCLVATHVHNPFHSVRRWNGHFFDHVTLYDLGLRIYLGHHGQRCPSAGSGDSTSLVVTDYNGIHKARVVYCRCVSYPAAVRQLTRSKLFPATTHTPGSAFTFRVLRQFQKHSSESGQNAFSYFAALRRFTTDVAKDNVTNRYREFLRVTRMWGHLQAEKYSGQALGIAARFPGVRSDSYAVLCPACPQPLINMPSNWDQVAPDKRHLHAIILAADGNFSLDQHAKNSDPDDVSLDGGRGFFVEHTEFNDYIAKYSGDLENEASTCSGFKAGDILRSFRTKKLVVSGVVGISCARHSMIRPEGMVDLQKGERFRNVDYAFAKSIRDLLVLHAGLFVVLSYDVSCQYKIHFGARLQEWFPEILPHLKNLVFVVPKMHIKAHKPDCAYFYAFDYTPHVGQTDGEGAERIWRETNQYSGSTREMNAGHRHDRLNSHFNDWNWRKTQGMAKFLARKYASARESCEAYEEEFQGLCDLIPPGLQKQWEPLSTTAIRLRDGRVESVFKPDEHKIPTQADIRAQIAKEEGAGIHPDASDISRLDLANLFVEGFAIIELQHSTAHHAEVTTHSPTATNVDRLEEMRSTLRSRLSKWYPLQATLLPRLVRHLDDIEHDIRAEDEPELASVEFPSTLSGHRRAQLGLVAAADVERRVREAQAFDALANVKEALIHKIGNVNARAALVRGQKGATRAANIINRQADLVQKHTDTYRRARAALLALGMCASDRTFRELQAEHCTCKAMFPDQKKVTDASPSSKRLSWIWTVGHAIDPEDDTWTVEAHRVQWFISRAQRDRWREELEILEEEMRRVVRFCVCYHKVWSQLSENEEAPEGYRAYSSKKAAMWANLERNARKHFPIAVLQAL